MADGESTYCGHCGAELGCCGCWHEREDEHAPALWRSPLGTIHADGSAVVAWQPLLHVGHYQGVPVFEVVSGKWVHDDPEQAVENARRGAAHGPRLRGKSWADLQNPRL